VFEPSALIARVSSNKSLDATARFLLWSIFIYSFGFAVLSGCGKITTVIATTSVVGLLSWLLVIASTQLSWKLFGGKMEWVEFCCVYAYVCGATLVVWIPVHILPMAGIYFLLGRVGVPEYRSLALQAVFLLLQLLYGAVWMRPAQEWFRHGQALSRWRSFGAKTLFGVVALPIVALTIYVVCYGAVGIAGLVEL
jgi:hypothetical protein